MMSASAANGAGVGYGGHPVAIVDDPALTRMTLADVRSAWESAVELADDIENGDPWDIADWRDKAVMIAGLLEEALRAHRVWLG